MKNIHILPTENPSSLFEIDGHLIINKEQLIQPKYYRNIYITSDEEIKEDDWGLSKLNEVILFGRSYNEKFYKKIILTTDQDLIKDGVQAIEDEFLEWFIKNPSCEYIQTTELSLFNGDTGESGHYKYEIIIPKEEPKQDTVGKEFYESADKVITVKRQEKKPHSFCETPEEQCTMNYCDENGCQNRVRHLVEQKQHLIDLMRLDEEQQIFIKPNNIDGQWLSPVPTERAWQEEKLVEIFEHYPTASPRWQYMNGLIQNSLDAKQMYSEQELRNAMNWMLTQYFEFYEWPAMGRVNHYIETIKQQEQ